MELVDFEKKDLVAIADGFAVDIDPSKTKQVIADVLKEENITVGQIFANNAALKEKYNPTHQEAIDEVAPTNVVTAQATQAPVEDIREVPEEREARVTQQNTVAQAQPAQQFLVKMRRKNPVFETGGYRFTTEHPYAVVEASDLNLVLSEEGFSIATPDEVTEYYS